MVLSVHNHNRVVKLYNNKIINCMVNGMRLKNYSENYSFLVAYFFA